MTTAKERKPTPLSGLPAVITTLVSLSVDASATGAQADYKRIATTTAPTSPSLPFAVPIPRLPNMTAPQLPTSSIRPTRTCRTATFHGPRTKKKLVSLSRVLLHVWSSLTHCDDDDGPWRPQQQQQQQNGQWNGVFSLDCSMGCCC